MKEELLEDWNRSESTSDLCYVPIYEQNPRFSCIHSIWRLVAQPQGVHTDGARVLEFAQAVVHTLDWSACLQMSLAHLSSGTDMAMSLKFAHLSTRETLILRIVRQGAPDGFRNRRRWTSIMRLGYLCPPCIPCSVTSHHSWESAQILAVIQGHP